MILAITALIVGIYELIHRDYILGPVLILITITEWLTMLGDNVMWGHADENHWYPNEKPSFVEKLLANLLSVRVILQGGLLYLRRFYLSPRWKILPFRIFLHHIMLSDTDAALHDHPFDFTTILLWNSYTETIIKNGTLYTETYGPGSILHRKADDIHRLQLEKPVWTLVIASKAEREWGFWPKIPTTENSFQFVPWYKFLNKSKYDNEYPEDQI